MYLWILVSTDKYWKKSTRVSKSTSTSTSTPSLELSKEANSVDPEQTAPIGAVWSGSTLFAIEAS